MEAVVHFADSLDFFTPKYEEEEFSAQALIKVLEELTSLKQQVHELTVLLERKTTFVSTSDLYHLPNLKQKLEIITTLCKHLSDVASSKNTLSAYLQQPFSGDFLVINAEKQRQFHYVMTSISKNISTLNNDITALKWGTKQFSLEDGQLEKTLKSIETFFARFQRYHEALSSVQKTVEQILVLNDANTDTSPQ